MRQPTLQATKSACVLAARGTPEQAIALLNLLPPMSRASPTTIGRPTTNTPPHASTSLYRIPPSPWRP